MKSAAYIVIAVLLTLNGYLAGWHSGWELGVQTGRAEKIAKDAHMCFIHNGEKCE